MSTGIAIWTGLWALAAVGVAVASPRIGRLRAAAWMITIAVVLLIGEDPGLLAWYATAGPSIDSDGVAGLVHAHTQARMYGGSGWSVAAMALGVLIAHGWLARGQRAGWAVLLVLLVSGGAGDMVALTVYPHGLPLFPAPPGGNRGFGWPALVGGLVIWSFAITWAAGPIFRPSTTKA